MQATSRPLRFESFASFVKFRKTVDALPLAQRMRIDVAVPRGAGEDDDDEAAPKKPTNKAPAATPPVPAAVAATAAFAQQFKWTAEPDARPGTAGQSRP